MKTIAELTGGDFLRRCNKIRHRVSEILESTGVWEIRKRMPELSGNETAEERNLKFEEQSKKNIDAMLDCLLEEHTEKTMELLNLLIIREECDPEIIPDFDLIAAGLSMISNKKMMDFFISVVNSGLMSTLT